jgi:hypothetical protein
VGAKGIEEEEEEEEDYVAHYPLAEIYTQYFMTFVIRRLLFY